LPRPTQTLTRLPCPVRWMAALVVSVLLALAWPATAQNNGEEAPDFARWEALAERAEAGLTDRNMPDATLEALRTQIAAMRAEFVIAQAFNRERIAVLREQLDALGPPPGEGEIEAPEITERRADLTERMARRQAPLVAADEAFRRADAIIRSIDRLLRERQADALMRLWPTPLNPANWPQGVNALISSALTVYGEVYNAWLDPALRAAFRSDLPVTLGALALALLLLARGRFWMETLTTRLLLSTAILRGRVVAAFFLSLAQILVPFAGLSALFFAVLSTSLTGPTIEDLAQTMVRAGLVLVFARWLALQIFPVIADPGLSLTLADPDRRRGRRVTLLLGLFMAIELLLRAFLQPEQQTEAANAVLMFPLIVLVSLGLWRMGLILQGHHPVAARPDTPSAEAGPSTFDRLVALGARALTIVAIAAPVLAAVGYVTAAMQLVFPAVASLALLGVVMVLHRLAVAIYAAVVGVEDGAADALVPALVGMTLTLGALPILALIWGVRATELLELWIRFREGFSLGETRISPTNIIAFFLVFAIGFVLTRGIQGALASSVLPKTKMEKGAQKAIVSGLGYVGVFIAALVAFSTAGINLAGLAIVAGALSVGIGFGLQNIVSNFVSGLILLIERPVSEGDWVEVGTTSGFVSRISVRSTVIETFDKSEVIVPNSDLISGVVTNFTKTNKTGRVIVRVAVAYGTDTRRVEAILREIAEAHPVVAIDPKPAVLFMNFGADGLEFEVRAILRDVGFKLRVQSDINHQIALRFGQEGIEIPFAQRDIWLRNPEALSGARPPVAPVAAAVGATALAGGALAATLRDDPPAPETHEDLSDDNDPDDEDDR
jgi:potassium-dependent mechanosensitive channel